MPEEAPDSFLVPTRPSKVRRTSATDAAASPATAEQIVAAHSRLLAVLVAAAYADAASALKATRALFEWLDNADTLEEKGRCCCGCGTAPPPQACTRSSYIVVTCCRLQAFEAIAVDVDMNRIQG